MYHLVHELALSTEIADQVLHVLALSGACHLMLISFPPSPLAMGGPCSEVPTSQETTFVFGSMKPGWISNSHVEPIVSAWGMKNFKDAAFAGADATADIVYVA